MVEIHYGVGKGVYEVCLTEEEHYTLWKNKWHKLPLGLIKLAIENLLEQSKGSENQDGRII